IDLSCPEWPNRTLAPGRKQGSRTGEAARVGAPPAKTLSVAVEHVAERGHVDARGGVAGALAASRMRASSAPPRSPPSDSEDRPI
ncbi:unnamed protein product, partial [Urochloa humidicola]